MEEISANVIPPLLTLKPTEDESNRGEAPDHKGQSESWEELLNKNLTVLLGWSLDEQKKAWELLVEYASIFTMRGMDLGKIFLVKHSIRLMENTSFKEYLLAYPTTYV